MIMHPLTSMSNMQNIKRVIDIKKLELIEGSLPRRAQELALDWAELHQAELLEDWALCAARQQPNKIAPLK